MQVIVYSNLFNLFVANYLYRYGHEMDENAFDSRYVKKVKVYTAFFGTELEIEVSKCRQCCDLGRTNSCYGPDLRFHHLINLNNNTIMSHHMIHQCSLMVLGSPNSFHDYHRLINDNYCQMKSSLSVLPYKRMLDVSEAISFGRVGRVGRVARVARVARIT